MAQYAQIYPKEELTALPASGRIVVSIPGAMIRAVEPIWYALIFVVQRHGAFSSRTEDTERLPAKS